MNPYSPNDQTMPTYPSNNFYAPMPPVPPVRSSWWSRQSRAKRVWLSCGGIIVGSLLLCIFTTVAAAAFPPPKSVASSPTPIVQNHSLTAIHVPTATPTPAPTPTPVPPTPTPLPQVQPTSVPTQPPAPSCNGTVVDGICYSFDASGGSYVYSPAADFCAYFSCIANFYKGIGYVIECNDGMYSKSGGRSGSCSYHGGDLRPIYQH